MRTQSCEGRIITWPFSAVILAGGKSSRMGSDKARLQAGGQTLLARQIQLARDAGAAEVFISGRAGQDYAEFGCVVLHDLFIDCGPLAGIERALAICQASLLLTLAVDLPNLPLEALREVGLLCQENAGAVPRVNANLEPLAAFYPKAAHPLVKRLLAQKALSARNFARACASRGLVKLVDLPENRARFFANWNSPLDRNPQTK